jgi:hypothetical protein
LKWLGTTGSVGASFLLERDHEVVAMSNFKVGDHVEWRYEGGVTTGTITRKVTSEITFKGYTRHASEKDPQYIIKSDQSNHEAMHKGAALRPCKKKKVS